MKYFHLYVILALAAIVLCGKLHKNHRTKESKNLMFVFLHSAIKGLAVDPKFIDECASEVKDWEDVGTKEGQILSVDKEIKEQITIFKSAIKKIEKETEVNDLSFVCIAREGIEKAILFGKRFRRTFNEGRRSRRNDKASWNANDVFAKAESDFSKAAESMSKGQENGKESKWQGKNLSDIKNFLKEKLTHLFKPIYDILDKLVQKLVKYLTENPIIVAFRGFINCFFRKEEIKHDKKAHNVLEKIDTFIPRLGNTDTNVLFVINLICHLHKLELFIKELEKPGPPGIEEQYIRFGTFTSQFFHIITHSKIKDVKEIKENGTKRLY